VRVRVCVRACVRACVREGNCRGDGAKTNNATVVTSLLEIAAAEVVAVEVALKQEIKAPAATLTALWILQHHGADASTVCACLSVTRPLKCTDCSCSKAPHAVESSQCGRRKKKTYAAMSFPASFASITLSCSS
jgi:hypothetical protein